MRRCPFPRVLPALPVAPHTDDRPSPPPANSCWPFTSSATREQRRLATQSGGNIAPGSRLSLPSRAEFPLLPEAPPTTPPRRGGRNRHSAYLPFLGGDSPLSGALHKADLRRREDDERDRAGAARCTDQTLGVRRAPPRRRRRGPLVALVSPESSTVQLDPGSPGMSKR